MKRLRNLLLMLSSFLSNTFCYIRSKCFIGDSLVLHETDVTFSGPEFRGFIHHINLESEEVLLKFHHKLHIDFDETAKYNVSFSYSRLPLRRCHLAVQVCFAILLIILLFASCNFPYYN